jgi:hypothetical protein
MINTFSFAPYLIPIIGAVLHALIIVSYVWFSEEYTPDNRKKEILFSGFRFVFYSIYLFIGIILLHTSIMYISGQWIYADYAYQLPSVILGIIIGIEYVIGTLFLKPKKKTLILGIVSILTFIIMIHGYFAYTPRLKASFGDLIWVWVGCVVIGILGGIKNYKSDKEVQKPLWDITPSFKKIYSRKINCIIWVIAVIETVLKFFGSSLFIW